MGYAMSLPVNSICVFAGSSPGSDPSFTEAARELGSELASRNITVVFGGGSVGVMGDLADGALAGGGRVIGVIPEALTAREIAHPLASEMIVVQTMHERKARMASLADGFIALPGGLGTLEELFEVLTWAQLGIHGKPCGLLNVKGYYDRLLAFLDHAVESRLLRSVHRHLLLTSDNGGELLDRFGSYNAPSVPKWMGPDET